MLETGGGRGSRLFTARKSRMENYTRSGMGKTTGLPTGNYLFKMSSQQF
jgi:hypothetical protein